MRSPSKAGGLSANHDLSEKKPFGKTEYNGIYKEAKRDDL